jgi:hypothetical protein
MYHHHVRLSESFIMVVPAISKTIAAARNSQLCIFYISLIGRRSRQKNRRM